MAASFAAASDIETTYPSVAEGDTRLDYPLAVLELAVDRAGVSYDLVA